MKINITPEVCCEICNEIVHNHFDCPNCQTKYTSSEQYHHLGEYPNELIILECEKCKAVFQLVSGKPYDDDAEWKQTGALFNG